MKRYFLFTSLALAATAVSAAPMPFECHFTSQATSERVSKLKTPMVLRLLVESESATEVAGAQRLPLKVVANNPITLLRTTDDGEVMLTAIRNGGHAAHSRHVATPSGMTSTQYYGHCLVG